MFGADLLEDVRVHLAVNTPHRITTKNIDVVDPGQLVTQLFVLNRSMDVTLCPEQMSTFAEKCNAGTLRRRSLCCRTNEDSKGLHKPNRIKCVIDHECREGLRAIQSDISALFNSRNDIHTLSLQSWKKTVPV